MSKFVWQLYKDTNVIKDCKQIGTHLGISSLFIKHHTFVSHIDCIPFTPVVVVHNYIMGRIL